MNLQGFKRTKEIPSGCQRRPGHSKWDDVIDVVLKESCILAYDPGDKVRTKSVANSIRIRARKRQVPIKVTVQDTYIYVSKRKED